MMFDRMRKLFEVPRVEGQDKIDAFFDELIRGRRLPVYEDGRRVPLEIFNSPLRLLLVSQDPKHRYLVRAAGRFRTKAEINIREWPEDDAIPDVRPARDRAWHLDQLEKLALAVERARTKDPSGYASTSNAKLLAAIRKLMFEVILSPPA